MMNEVDDGKKQGDYSKDWVIHSLTERRAVCDFERGR